MTTCLGKSCSFGLPRVPFVNCCQCMYLVVSLLVTFSEFVKMASTNESLLFDVRQISSFIKFFRTNPENVTKLVQL